MIYYFSLNYYFILNCQELSHLADTAPHAWTPGNVSSLVAFTRTVSRRGSQKDSTGEYWGVDVAQVNIGGVDVAQVNIGGVDVAQVNIGGVNVA